jgi:uncharacterized membrane protein SpoIIM required for sporulation
MTDTVVAGAATWRRGLRRALVAAPVVAVAAATLGYLSMRGSQGGTADAITSSATFTQILARNVPAALLLFSGVATAGSSTLVALLLLGGYVGATFATAATAVGTLSAFGSIASYAPLELTALLLAAVGGLLPAATVIGRPEAVRRRDAYAAALSPSLGLLLLSIAMLAVAAAVEALVIHGRTP